MKSKLNALRHGHRRNGHKSKEYRTWLGIKRRCFDVKYKDYPMWGGQGITVCERWNISFEAFLSDMGAAPSEKHQIDRINHRGDYEPSNCRWVTPAQQSAENRSGLIAVEAFGVSYPNAAAACRAFGVGITTFHYRIKSGIPVEEALTAGPRELPSRRDRLSYLSKDHPARRLEGLPCPRSA